MPLPRNRRTTDNHIMAIYIQYNTKSNAMNTGKLLFVPSGGLANRMRYGIGMAVSSKYRG